MLGLRLCVRAFSCCGKWGATLHRGARASYCHGLSCCGAQAPDSTHFKSSKTPDKCLCSPPRPGESVPSVRDTWKAEWKSACGPSPGARVCEFLRRALNFCSCCWLDTVVGKWWRVPCIQDMIVVTAPQLQPFLQGTCHSPAKPLTGRSDSAADRRTLNQRGPGQLAHIFKWFQNKSSICIKPLDN